jgi:sensor c-di-GMP phosphodiesterase-like protein
VRRGVRFGQGFHFARPMPLAEFLDGLARRQPPADSTRPMAPAATAPGSIIRV